MTPSAIFLGLSADEQFKQWQSKHPHGFYLNIKAKQSGMLHSSDCWHLGAGEGMNAVTYPKVCSDTIEELEKWATDNGVTCKDCPDCKVRQG